MPIWDRWIEEHGEQSVIPAIIPVVLSYVEGGWKKPVSMHELCSPRVVELAGKHCTCQVWIGLPE